MVYNAQKTDQTIEVSLSGDRVEDGSLGMNPNESYYVYDFWNDKLIGKYDGENHFEANLKAEQSLMYSVRQVQGNPQILSTSRHILQGFLDLKDVQWNGKKQALSGTALVVKDEPFRITMAGNGLKPHRIHSQSGFEMSYQNKGGDLYEVVILSSENKAVEWALFFK